MIDQPTIDRILDAAQIVDVVSEFVTLRKRGVNFVGLCPFHDDKTPSFYVSPAKGLCKCFACGKGGNAVHFVMEHEQMTYPEALRWLAKKYNIEIKERELTDEEKQVQNIRESLFVVNEFARDYFQNILYNHADGKAIAMSYSANGAFVTRLSRNSNWDTALPLLTHWHKKPCEKDIKKNFCSRPDYVTKKKMAVYATVFGDV